MFISMAVLRDQGDLDPIVLDTVEAQSSKYMAIVRKFLYYNSLSKIYSN